MYKISFLVLIVFWFVSGISSDDNEGEFELPKMQNKCLNNQQYVLSVTSELSTNARKRHIIKNHLYNPRSDQRSLVIVFDATGSMQDSLNILRNSARKIIDTFSLRSDSPIYNYIFVPFRDPETGPAVVSIDSSKLLKTLDELRVFGGNSCPENTLSGISLALKYALPKSFVYVFTDATAHDYHLENTVSEQIQQKQATITFLVMDDCNQSNSNGYRTFENLSKSSNGKIYRIKINEIDEVLSDIEDKLDDRNTILAAVHSPNAGSNVFNVSIDKNLNEFTVDVTGSRPEIKITDPKNDIFRNSIDKLSLEQVKIVKVIKPMSGKWQVETKARSPKSTRISAISDIIFDFGFSQSLPKSIQDTSYTPLSDTENHLIIKSSKDVNLTESRIEVLGDFHVTTSVSILGMKRIEQTEANEILYSTQPFRPSNEPFKIIVKGFDEDGNDIMRVLSSELRASPGRAPDVFMAQTEIDLFEGETLIIKCHIDSLTATRITMMHYTEQLRAWKSDQSISIEYKVESTSAEHEGIYKCIASNSYGTSERSVKISIINRTFMEYKLIENQTNVEIPCNPSSKLRLRASLKWFFGESEIIPDNKVYKTENMKLIIPKLAKELAGWYTCKIVSHNVETKAEIYIKVLYAPRVHEPLFEEAIVQYEEMLNIGCTIDSEPISNIQWKFRQKNEEKFVIFEQNPFPLKNFSDEHEGLYICIAKNDIDSIERLIKVKGSATRKPKIIKNYSKSIVASVGDDLKLKCRCKMCEPITEFMWIHENIETKQSISLIGQHMKGNWSNQADLTLTLTNLKLNNTGIYKCIMANQFGSDIHDIPVIVKQPRAIHLHEADNNENMYKNNEQIVSHCTLQNIFNSTIESDDNEAPILRPARAYKCSASVALGDVSVKNYSTLLIGYYEFNKVGLTISNGSNTNFASCKLYKLRTPDITKLFVGSYIDSNENYVSNLCNITENIYECRQSFTSDPAPLTFVLFDVFDLYSDKRNGTAEIISKQVPMVVCSKMLKASELNEPLATKSDILASSYSCEWFSLNGPIDVFNFIADDPPEITSTLPVKLKLIRGANATLSCYGVGNPEPSNYWIDGNTTKFSADYQLNTGIEMFKNKNVTCISKNTIGTDAHSVIVHVIDIPEATRTLTENSFDNVLIGTQISLNCPFRHFDSIQWFKDGISVDKHDQDGSLEFMNITLKENGTYSCHVSNAAGSRYYEHTVFVNFPPEVVLEHEIELANASKIDVVLSNPFSVRCNVMGYPIPRTIWTHNGYLVLAKNLLTISNTSILNAGEYVCTAENEHGSDQMAFELNVQYPPEIVTKLPSELNIVKNESVSLSCTAVGNPVPNTYWIDGNTTYIGDVHLNTINEIFKTKNLTCRSVNSLGVDNHTTVIHLIDVPEASRDLSAFSFDDVLLGSNVSMLCPFRNFDQVFWYKKEIESYHWNNEFILPNVSLNDNGTYICHVSNIAGSRQHEHSIFVNYPPKVELKNDNKTFDGFSLDVILSEPFHMECIAIGYPNPEVKWEHNGNIISVNNVLTIDSVALNDAGDYACIAYNKYGIDTKKMELNVKYSPQITSELPIELSLVRGGNATLSCFGVGNPEPSNYWIDGNTTKFSADYQLNTGIEMFKNKNVTCISENTIGTDAHSVIVHVIDIPEATRTLTENSFDNVLIGTQISLDCPFRHFDSIQWFKDGISVDKHDQDGSLEFMNITLKENGTYSCHVSNAAGSRYYEHTVFVNVPPEVVLEHEIELANASKIDVVLSNPFSVRCNVMGYPIPRTMWTHNGILISTRNILTIHNTSILNAGEYVCSAENYHGLSRFVLQLNVQFAPILSMAPEHIIVSNQNESVDLECSMEANPPAEYVWFKDGLEIDEQKLSSLKIARADLKDTGSYECVANNDFGNAAVKFTVNINAVATIIYISENATIKSDTKLILICEALGNPMPILIWMQDQKKIFTTDYDRYPPQTGNDTYLIDNKGNLYRNKIANKISDSDVCAKIKYDLTAFSVKMSLYCIETRKNFEKFSCFAINVFGQDYRSVSIQAIAAPKFENHSIAMIEVLDGFPVTMVCDVVGYPKPAVIWRKQNQTIDTSGASRHYFGTSDDGKRLHIHSSNRNDGGSYSCLCKNAYGSDELFFHLDVLTPPHLDTLDTTESETINIFTGDSIDLNCPIKGNPRPAIYWTESDRIGDNESLFPNSTLHLDSVQEAKIIRCYANSTLGELEYTFEIVIQKPPTIIGPTIEYKIVHVNDNILLDCTVSAVPKANLTWYKDDIQLTLDNQTYGKIAERTFLSSNQKCLRVFRLISQLFGNYSCIAANPFGSVRKDFIVGFEPYFGGWNAWSVCSKKCDEGTKRRERFCHKMDRYSLNMGCKGERLQTRPCFIRPCDSFEWEEWSVCSVTCGQGQQYRLLKCVQGTCNIKVKKTEYRSCKEISCGSTDDDY